jgi:TonB family protein
MRQVHPSILKAAFRFLSADFRGILAPRQDADWFFKCFEPMLEPKARIVRPKFKESGHPGAPRSAEPKQRRAMEIALTLLLVALGFVIYHDRDFWFPPSQESQEADDSPSEHTPAGGATGRSNPGTSNPGTTTARGTIPGKSKAPLPPNDARNRGPGAPLAKNATGAASPGGDLAIGGAGLVASTQRTLLPPLEVEVVAGNVHRTVRPGSNSVRVDVQASSPPTEVAEPATPSATSNPASAVTRNASEHVQISTDASAVVRTSVKPAYPLLARQMKVQGSVILQALIGRDGAIQDLHVMSGPPILAGAAREAVRQWRFKPHFQGADSVETQAKITVNFTISTN